MTKALAVVLLLFSASLAFTQTTYTSTIPYPCNPTTRVKVLTWDKFECHAVTAESAKYQFYGSGSRFEMFDPFAIPPNSSLALTSFTQPANGNPGTYAYNWSGVDENGVEHEGSASGTWRVGGPNWRGWYWAILVTNSITVDF